MKEHIRKTAMRERKVLNNLAAYIWEHPEIAEKEEQCAAYQIKLLEERGFTIQKFRGLPTAFLAAYGSGKIKIGLASEYDALPGLSQHRCPQRSGNQQEAGHGCGHNLICTGCMCAAFALRELILDNMLDATVYYYGCAAEETLVGKHIMIEEGAFSNLDMCLTWHPFDVNKVYEASTLAAATIKFDFTGISSHASVAPHRGRSALDAVELMNVGANYLREHIIDSARVHYIITNGGLQANIVPSHAASEYMIRAPKMEQVLEILNRVIKIAQGASLMTETKMEYRVISGNYEFNPNKTLNSVLGKYFSSIQFPKMNIEDEKIYRGIADKISDDERRDSCLKFGVKPYDIKNKVIMGFFDPTDWSEKVLPGSSDLGDVSFLAPVGKISGAAWALGTANHTWQATACSGTTYATDLAILMGEVMAQAAYEVACSPQLLQQVKQDFDRSVAGITYRPIKDYRAE